MNIPIKDSGVTLLQYNPYGMIKTTPFSLNKDGALAVRWLQIPSLIPNLFFERFLRFKKLTKCARNQSQFFFYQRKTLED